MENNFLVSVRCISYNHAPYIKDCMNGFTMQETNFPYVCVIDDDASTDGEPEVINNYLAENFNLDDEDVVRREETDDYRMIFAQHKTNQNCFFAVYFLKYNHYSIRKSRDSYVARFADGTKYMAICEGDDYWIDSLKLQKQVDFLENHPNYTLVCNRSYLYSERKKKLVGESYCYNKSQNIDIKDVINRGGNFIVTCSIMYRRSIMDTGYPDYCKKCHVGDYPLQVFASMKGQAYFINDIMSVYRIDNPNSWVGKRRKVGIIQLISSVRSEVDLYDGFSIDYPQYCELFCNKMMSYINQQIPGRHYSRREQKEFLDSFNDKIDRYTLLGKIDLLVCSIRIRGMKRLSPFSLTGKYSIKRVLY